MGLNPAQAYLLQQLISEAKRRESGGRFADFIRTAWPIMEPNRPFIPGWHIDAIAEHLEAVLAGEIRNLLINIPPRHAKSTIVSVAYPAWVWTLQAEHKFLFGSHNFNLSKRDSVKCRSLVTSEWYRDTFKINWKLREDQNEKRRFDNTEGGSRISTSVMASVIGEGADTLVLDDPHSPRSVRSEVKREDELEWIDTEFFTRINDPKTVSKIAIMQRLDERDASAHVLAKGDWEHLMLPAEFEPQRKCFTSLGWEDPRTEPGEPLWPARFGVEENNRAKKSMGDKAWSGQGQQRPSPSDGAIFKRAHLNNFYTVIPEDLEFIALSIDLPFDEGGSFAVFQVWGKKGPRKYLLDQVRGQVGFNEQKTMFRSMVAKWPLMHAKWIEKKANGAAIISTMQLEFSGLIPITPQGSKEVRAEAVAPEFESGCVWLPDPSIAPWINDYIEELIVFNNGLFNDQVDATTQALMKMMTEKTTDWVPVSLTGASKWIR